LRSLKPPKKVGKITFNSRGALNQHDCNR